MELLLDFLDENGRLIFGGVTIVIVLSCFLPLFMMGVSGAGGDASPKPTTKPTTEKDEKRPSPRKKTPKAD